MKVTLAGFVGGLLVIGAFVSSPEFNPFASVHLSLALPNAGTQVAQVGNDNAADTSASDSNNLQLDGLNALPAPASGATVTIPSSSGGSVPQSGSANTGSPSGSGLVPCGNAGQHACQACDLVTLAQKIMEFGIYFAVAISSVMFAIAGFLYLTSAGDEHKIEEAHGIFKNVLIGILIVMLAWLIVDTIMKAVFIGDLQQAGFGPWNQVKCTQFVPAPAPLGQ